jgi:hypothetical protein
MTDQEDAPKTVPPAKDTGRGMTDEQRARQAQSPEEGYPANTTDPLGGLGGDEGKVNADSAPGIAEDAEKGQTAVPIPSDEKAPPRSE